MTKCDEMKVGQVYVCEDEECGLELQVLKPCKDSGTPTKSECSPCTFVCCGKELKLKA